MKRIALVVVPALFAACIPMNARIEQANAEHVQRMCGDADYAYESGYNSGLERRRLDTTWVDTTCVPEARPQVRTAYQTGYEQGMQHAPIVVNGLRGGGGRAGGYAVSATSSCTFSSDCGDGQSCRRDSATGADVCMGGGYTGDACWFSSDCVSNECTHNRCE
jgi:hypothetical protein